MTASGGLTQVTALSRVTAPLPLATCHRPAPHIPVTGEETRRSA
jgi:hypothetical protein